MPPRIQPNPAKKLEAIGLSDCYTPTGTGFGTVHWHFVRKRQDLIYRGLFVLFALFIFFCAAAHAFAILTTWKPYYVVQLMGGNLNVVSEPGEGSTFTATFVFETLGKKERESDSRPRIQERKIFPKLAGKRVLVAEDNKGNQRLTRKLLEGQGCIVTVVATGTDAVTKVRESTYAAEFDETRSTDAGVDAFSSKPFDTRKLLSTLDRLINQSS